MITDPQSRTSEMKAALVARGVALTSRRRALLEILASSDRHPRVSEIHQEVRRSHPKTSLATVYNTIELLKEAGQVLEIEFSGTANRYDGRRCDPHPHLICVRCGKIEDLEGIENNGSLEAISAATGYQVSRQRTDYYGACPNCQIA